RSAIADGAVVLDARSPDEFAEQHLAGSLNIGIDGRFAETAGMMLGEHDRTVIIAPSRRAAEAALRLRRGGLDRVVGAVEDSAAVFAELSDQTTSSTRD